MHITTVCPACETRFQVDPSLRGQMMRCPNPDCREVFEVAEFSPPTDAPGSTRREAVRPVAPVPPPRSRPVVPPGRTVATSGHVEDMIPVVEARAAGPAAEPAARESPPEETAPEEPPALAWDEAPPPVRSGAAAPPAPEPPHSGADWGAMYPERPGPDSGETFAGADWEPPPVRRGPSTGESTAAVSPELSEAPASGGPLAPAPAPAFAPAVAKARRARRLMVGIAAAVLGILGVAGVVAWNAVRNSESSLLAQAQREYAEGHYHLAAASYRKLAAGFPDSAQAGEYKFLQQLSEVRAFEQSVDVGQGLERVAEFVRAGAKDDRLVAHGGEVGQTLGRLLDEAARVAGERPDDADAAGLLRRGQEVLAELDTRDKGWVGAEARERLSRAAAEAQKRAEAAGRRRGLLEKLAALSGKPSAESVRQMRELMRQPLPEGAGTDKDAEVAEAVGRVYAAHRGAVVYTAQGSPSPGPSPGQGQATGQDGDPLLRPGAPAESPEDHVVFGLAHGLLRALWQKTGKTAWDVRVGIDTTSLPVVLPAAGGRPEMALVLSADTRTLTARNARTGERLWQCPLSDACLGRPVVHDGRAYVATIDGKVHEVELAGGGLLGQFDTGQRLTGGGTRLEGTSVLVVPAADTCVYLLDVGRRECAGILYTDHAAGSLRGDPVFLAAEDAEAGGGQGHLVLGLARGPHEMVLRSYRLPLAEPGAGPVDMPEPRLPGWSWFTPHHDAEKLVLATDEGSLGLFGVAQPRNQDPLLFPLVRQKAGAIDAPPPGTVPLAGAAGARDRAQVVLVRGNDYWVLARGQLQRWVLGFDREEGLQLVKHPRWREGLALGSPVHEAQVSEDGGLLTLVTHVGDQPTCLATAVEAATGIRAWQRPLGLLSHGEPLARGDTLLALDRGGGLFKLTVPAAGDGTPGPSRGAVSQRLAETLPGLPPDRLFLLAGPDGATAYEVACPGSGRHVVVRQYGPEAGPVQSREVDVQAPLAGTPAVGDVEAGLLLPLADGSLARLALPVRAGGAGDKLDGPSWRAGRGGERPGHVTWLGGGDFLTSNGKNGLTRWHFEGPVWRAVPTGRDARAPTVELPEAVAAPAVVVRPAGEAGPLRVCVADTRGTLYLLEGEELKPVRRWALGGATGARVTAGPYVEGDRIGVVLDRRRLVWIDPDREELPWAGPYETAGEAIVGQPRRIGESLVVADEGGRIVGLDPATGRKLGEGYVLPGSVAPAASPVPAGTGQMLVPQSDGLLPVLPLGVLRGSGAPASPPA